MKSPTERKIDTANRVLRQAEIIRYRCVDCKRMVPISDVYMFIDVADCVCKACAKEDG